MTPKRRRTTHRHASRRRRAESPAPSVTAESTADVVRSDSWPVVRHVQAWWISALVIASAGVAASWNLLTGRETFFFRDLGTTHIPLRAIYTTIGAARSNPFASFGQPYAGNPNALVYYPFPHDPRWLSCQILLHLLLAALGTVVLLRILGRSADAALFGAVSFVLSGYVLSAASSLNAITTVGWIPWFLTACVTLRASRRAWLSAAAVAAVATMLSISGEPVLVAMTIVLGLVLTGFRRAWLTLLSVTGGYALLFPIHLGTVLAVANSYRMQTGYDFDAATTASLHPARLLECVIPLLFGDPSKIGPGTFWGYAVSNGAPPYVYSIAVSVVTLLCAGVAVRLRVTRTNPWTWIAFVALIAGMGNFLPGSLLVFNALPLLRHVRFPIKFLLVATLAVAVLAAEGFDRLIVSPEPAARRRARRLAIVGAIVCFCGAVVAAMNVAGVESILVRLWWDATWPSRPHSVLEPIVAGVAPRLVAVSVMLAVAAWVVTARKKLAGAAILQLMVAADLAVSGVHLLPAVSAADYAAASPLVEVLRHRPGRIFERIAKDLDPVRSVMQGDYPANSVLYLAIAQSRQAWALSGARFGLRYAYDHSSDGTYADREERVTSVIDNDPWPLRLKWLRAAGVTTLLGSDMPLPKLGLARVAQESQVGVPTTAYAITGTLPEVRRAAGIVWVRTFQDAVRAFEEPSFDPAKRVILESDRPEQLSGSEVAGATRIIHDSADRTEIATCGPVRAALFVARNYSPNMQAMVNGTVTQIYPANGHLCAVLVPPGDAKVVLSTFNR